MKNYLAALLIVFLGLNNTTASTLVATSSGNWNDPSTWFDATGDDDDDIPDSDDIVQIADGITVTCTSSVACSTLVYDFTVFSSGTAALIIIASGGTLTISDLTTINGGTAAGEIAEISLTDATFVLDMNGNLTFTSNLVSKAVITFDAAGTVRLTGNITSTNGMIDTQPAGVAGSFVYDGSTAQVLYINNSDFEYPNITINNSAGSPTAVTLRAAINTGNLNEDLIISDGMLNTDGFAIVGGTGDEFKINANGTLNLNTTSSTFPTGFSLSTMSAGSTVEYSASGAQTIDDRDYANLTISTSGVKKLSTSSSVTVSETFTINGTATLDLDVNNQDISLFSIDDNHATDGIVNLNRTITFTGSGLATIDAVGSSSVNYGDVIFSNSVGTQLGTIGGFMVFHDITISSGGVLSPVANSIDCRGDFTNNGTFTAGTGILRMNTALNQDIGGTSTTKFFDLEIALGLGVTLQSNVELEGTLTLPDALFRLNGKSFTLLSTATRTARVGVVGTGSMTGSLTIQRLIPAVPDWRIMASPVPGATLSNWNSAIPMACITGGSHTSPHFTSVFTYDETVGGTSDNGYSADDDPGPVVTSLTDGLGSGSSVKGYMMWVGSCVPSCSPTTLLTSLTGTLVSGAQAIVCSFTSSAGDDDDGWNLIGNPYPSDFSWDAAAANRTGGLTGIIYVYDPSIDDFQSLNASLCCDRDVVPSMQGFFAKTSGSSGALVLGESDKVADGDNFLKTGGNDPATLELTISGNGYTDVVNFYFGAGGTPAYDPQTEALNPYSMQWDYANLSIVSSDSFDLQQNFMGDFDQDYTSPIKVDWTDPSPSPTVPSMSYTIDATDFSGVPLSSCVILEDTVTGTFTDLKAGPYTFTMAGAFGLDARFKLHLGASLAKDRVNPTCFGSNDGVGIAIGQGTGPWSYVWLNSSGDTLQVTSNVNSADTLTNLPQDVYSIYVTSGGGQCATSMDTLILIAQADFPYISQVTNSSCFGMLDGEIDITVSGGTEPYAYVWSSGDTIEDLTSMAAGNYSVVVTDMNACVSTYNFTITEPAELVINSNATNSTCNGDNDGSIDLIPSGGPTPYAYAWSNGETSEDISGLVPATYTVDVTDANNCTVSATFDITEPAAVVASFVADMDTTYLSEGGMIQFANTSAGASIFEWEFSDGTPQSNLMSPLHIYTGVGSFDVVLIASNINDCMNTTSKTMIVMNTPLVSIDDPDALSVKISYTTDDNGLYVAFSMEEPTDVTIRVFNILGQELNRFDETNVLNDRVKILDSRKTVATYLIRVDTTGGSASKKVVY